MASYADYTYYTGTFIAVVAGDILEVVDFVSSKAVAVGYVTVTADVIKA